MENWGNLGDEQSGGVVGTTLGPFLLGGEGAAGGITKCPSVGRRQAGCIRVEHVGASEFVLAYLAYLRYLAYGSEYVCPRSHAASGKVLWRRFFLGSEYFEVVFVPGGKAVAAAGITSWRWGRWAVYRYREFVGVKPDAIELEYLVAFKLDLEHFRHGLPHLEHA